MITEVSFTHSVTKTTRCSFHHNNMVECNAIYIEVTKNNEIVSKESFISYVSPDGIYLLRHYDDVKACFADYESIKTYADNHDIEQTTNFLKDEKRFNH